VIFALQTFPIIRYALFPFLEGSVEYFKHLAVSSGYGYSRLTRKNSGVFKKACPVLP
jgi:hypothetical protein